MKEKNRDEVLRKIYIRHKLQEIIHYTENCGLSDGKEIVTYIGYSLYRLNEHMEVKKLKLAK